MRLTSPASDDTFLYGKVHYYVQGVKYARYYDAKVASLLELENNSLVTRGTTSR